MASNTDIDQKVVDKIMKLLTMGKDKRTNENEAANALRMAQELADAYNLEMSTLAANVGTTHNTKRSDTKKSGGLYKWQRDIYTHVAVLNHCKHWVAEENDPNKVSAYWAKKLGAAEARAQGYTGKTWRHRLLGSSLNVLLTTQMSEYLEEAVERLARDYVDNDPKRYYVAEAIAFREGVADRIVEKLEQKRRDDIAEEKRKADEAAARGGGGGTALTITGYSDREKELNDDYLYGEGYTAKRKAEAAEREARIARQREAMEEAQRIQDAWDKANPGAAAERKAKEAAENAKYWADYEKKMRKSARRSRQPTYREPAYKPSKWDKAGYSAGHSAGSSVGLDRQMSKESKERLK